MHLCKKSSKQSLVRLKFCPPNKNRTSPRQNHWFFFWFFFNQFSSCHFTKSQFTSQTVTRFMETKKKKLTKKNKKNKNERKLRIWSRQIPSATPLTRYTHTHSIFSSSATPFLLHKTNAGTTLQNMWQFKSCGFVNAFTPHPLLAKQAEQAQMPFTVDTKALSPALKPSCVEPHKHYQFHKKIQGRNTSTTSALIRQEHICCGIEAIFYCAAL